MTVDTNGIARRPRPKPWVNLFRQLKTSYRPNSHRGRVVKGVGHLDGPCLELRCEGGREFDPRSGQYSRMSFSSDQVTGTVFPHLNMPFLPNSEFI